VSRAVVQWATEHEVGTLAVGDVRDIADGKRLKKEQQQKIGLWSHGRQRQYIAYKAQAAGIHVVLVDEQHTSKTCPARGHRYKPRGRIYRCPVKTGGVVGHRDAVGSVNILSRSRYGKRSRLVTPELARTAGAVVRAAVGL
jgi:putative transposase